MQKLAIELHRLYVPADKLPNELLVENMSGQKTHLTSLLSADGTTRAIVIPFEKLQAGEGAQHWSLLCEVANALQNELGLPAPAVSISADKGFALWLSLELPVSVGVAQQFVGLLRLAYFPQADIPAVGAPLAVPPCVSEQSGRWAAFINPGLGASFADESGLDMPPPLAGQVALLEQLESISEKKFLGAMEQLRQLLGAPAAAVATAPVPVPTAQGLLLKDATLEDIVNHLHGLDIEPTFRHLIRK
ncbi:MAG: hypothetical protein V4723_13915 [Pseudomonadota bacterium]